MTSVATEGSSERGVSFSPPAKLTAIPILSGPIEVEATRVARPQVCDLISVIPGFWTCRLRAGTDY